MLDQDMNYHNEIGSQNARALQNFEALQGLPANLYKCCHCGEVKNGNTKRNLVSHLKNKHHAIYEKSVKISPNQKTFAQQRLELVQNCVEIVTINKQPFTSLLKSGFSKIIADKLQMLEEAGFGVNLNRNLDVIKDHLRATAKRIREKIENEMKGRLISLSVDIVTKNNRSILGVYAQYVLNDEIVVRCIGMVELHESHTGLYLSKLIRECISEYEVDEDQIISVTTDNGRNVIKMIKHLNESKEPECPSTVCSTSDRPVNVSEPEKLHGDENSRAHSVPYEENENDDSEISDLLHELDLFDEVEMDELMYGDDDDECNDEWTLIHVEESELVENLKSEISFINTVNCAAHTLQLGINDGLKSLDGKAKNVIRLARQVAKFLRKQSTINEMKKCGLRLKCPRLDCVTRWNSTYLMVS